MKAKKASALLMILIFLLTTAGCKYKDAAKTTSSTTEISSATTGKAVSETSITDNEGTDISSSETTSAEESTTVKDSSSETESKSETEYSESDTSATDRKGFEISTIIDLSSLVDIDSYTKTGVQKQGEKFFDDAVFVGDSVTQGLRNYVTSERNDGRSCLGNAQFLCAGSLGYINSYSGVLEPTYQGNSVRIEDGIKKCGAKKVFIMLGMNDFCGYGEGVAEKAIRGTLDNIIQKNPNVTIYIESVTPILKAKQHDSFTNENIDAFNAKLQSICNEYKLTYVDINSVMRNSEGCLNPDYCGDSSAMGIHMSYPGCKAWINYLVNNF